MQKINRRYLRRLIENLMLEAEDEADITKFRGAKKSLKIMMTREPANDNVAAIKVSDKPLGLKSVGRALDIPTPAEYFIYVDSVDGSVGNLGPVRYSKGDPYTYKEVSKNKEGKRRFRVISGPRHRDKGARPIGAIFTPKQEPKIKIEDIAANVEIEGEGREIVKEYMDLCDRLNFKSDVPSDEAGNSVADAISALKFFGSFLLDHYLANDQKLPMQEIQTFEQVITAGRNYIGLSGKAARAMGVGMLFAPGIQSKETVKQNMLEFNKAMDTLGQIFEDVADDQEAADIIDSRLFFNPTKQQDLQDKVQAAEKETPGGGGAGIAGGSVDNPDALKESLSRGSLLRRRYRRY